MSTETESTEPRQPRTPLPYFWDVVRDAIEKGTVDDLKKACIGKHDINSNFPTFVELKPTAHISKDTAYVPFKGPTIIQYACLNERPEMVKYLLDNKAPDPLKLSTTGGYNAIHIASMTKDTSCLEILMKCKTVQENIAKPVEEKYEAPENVPRHTNALHCATTRNNIKTVILLTSPKLPKPEYDRKPDAEEGDFSQIPIPPPPEAPPKYHNDDDFTDDEDDETPQEEDDEEERQGIDVNSYTTNGVTALHIATHLKNTQMAYVLVCLHASPTVSRNEVEGLERKEDENLPQTPADMVKKWPDYDHAAKTGEVKKHRFERFFAKAGNDDELKSREQLLQLISEGVTDLEKAKAPEIATEGMPEIQQIVLPTLKTHEDTGKANPTEILEIPSQGDQLTYVLKQISDQMAEFNKRLYGLETKYRSGQVPRNSSTKDIVVQKCAGCGAANTKECPKCQKCFCNKCIGKDAHISHCTN